MAGPVSTRPGCAMGGVSPGQELIQRHTLISKRDNIILIWHGHTGQCCRFRGVVQTDANGAEVLAVPCVRRQAVTFVMPVILTDQGGRLNAQNYAKILIHRQLSPVTTAVSNMMMECYLSFLEVPSVSSSEQKSGG